MRFALMVLLAMSTGSVSAGEYSDARIHGNDLTFVSVKLGQLHAPKTVENQDGFADARISPDGNTIGWLAVRDYPSTLVLFRGGKVIQQFFTFGEVTDWRFLDDNSIIDRRQFPHGPAYLGFEYRRVSDGAILGEYECGCYHDGSGAVDAAPIPKWATTLATKCSKAASAC